ncbi:MAG: Bug family tripartite tricarboxylate transporter substrate binding protein [Comamonadaceae bacterium]|nr:Bug family tripartite tricarboxylate transporter substrate binding protein [Burkholderiales bacterium]MEB2347223.1 Bug family tripartite tricarboxylate transporter substrate binding protein [Comamonadaceae bacterium]
MALDKTRRAVLALCAGVSMLGAAQAQTGDRISGTIKLLVGFPAGGTGDIIARLAADKMAATLGTTVIVENRPGAGGRVAADVLKNAPADGRTILISPLAPIVIAPLTFRKLNYKPQTDFVPVAQLVKFPLALAVGGDSPSKNLNDLIAWFKANPQRAAFGTSAAGSQLHFLGLMLAQAAKLDLVHVPYLGSAPLVTDLIGGQVPAGIDQFPLEFYKTGKIRLLAVSSPTRSALMPDVPTFKEQGFPTVVGEAWFGAFAHVKTPAPIVQRISEALVSAMQQPDVKQKLAGAGLEATGLNAHDFAAVVAEDQARWKPVVEASGFHGD